MSISSNPHFRSAGIIDDAFSYFTKVRQNISNAERKTASRFSVKPANQHLVNLLSD